MIRGVDPAALALTLAIAGAGGAVAWALSVPLGFLIGAMLVTAVIAVAGWRPLGRALVLPLPLRMAFVPVIGVAIGSAVTPDVVQAIPSWLPTLAAVFLFVPLAMALAYGIFRAMGIGRDEALFGAVPGGLIESVQMAEEAGADQRVVTVLQFLRLILMVASVPLIFLWLTGGAVGSAAGVTLSGAALTLRDAGLLVLAGLAGLGLARLVRLPGWIITGPLLGSALVHGAGWVEGAPPLWLILATQVVLGAGQGVRFAGIERRILLQAGRAALVNALAGLALAFVFAEAFHLGVGEDLRAVFLAFAPGGLAEMSLVALSLQLSPIFVTAHHVVRIVLAVGLAVIVARHVRRR